MLAAILIGAVMGAIVVWFMARRRRWQPTIAPAQAADLVAADKAVLVDIREPREWGGGVARPAALLPYSDFRGARTKWRPFLEQNREKRLIIYCAAGVRAGEAVAILRREGFQAENLGGFRHWAAAGLDVRTGD